MEARAGADARARALDVPASGIAATPTAPWRLLRDEAGALLGSIQSTAALSTPVKRLSVRAATHVRTHKPRTLGQTWRYRARSCVVSSHGYTLVVLVQRSSRARRRMCTLPPLHTRGRGRKQQLSRQQRGTLRPPAMPPHGVPGSGTAPSASQYEAYNQLYGGGDGAEEYTLYRRRWYILASFSLLSFQQCLFWITYSPVAQATEKYYNVGQATVDLLLNWGPIVFVPVLPCVVRAAAHRESLPRLVRTGALLCALAAVLRLVPTWMPETFLGEHANTRGMALVHLGQVLNAAVGPIVMAPPPYLSQTWFAENERTTATALAVMANQFGAAIGFFAPWVVKSAADIPHLLSIHLALAVITLLMVVAYFPSRPPSPPSPAASMAAALPSAHKATVWDEFKGTLANPSFVVLALSGGVICGVYNAWTASLDSILPSALYPPKKAGWLGFASVMAAIVGGVAIGPIVDRIPMFKHRHKLVIIMIMASCTVMALWFTLSLPIAGISDHGLLPNSFLSSGAAVLMMGLLQGAAQPLYYELGVELTYPVSETMSAGFIVQFNNVAALTVLFVMPYVNKRAMNAIMTCTAVGCMALVVLVKERYRRVEAEAASRAGYAEAARGDMLHHSVMAGAEREGYGSVAGPRGGGAGAEGGASGGAASAAGGMHLLADHASGSP